MKYSYDRSFKFKINDDTWEAYLITEDELKELDANTGDDPLFEGDDDLPAMVLPSEKCLFLAEGNVDKGIIAHELFHVYNEYFHTKSANLDVDQYEEVVANFLEERLDMFCKKRNFLYKKFKKFEGA